MVAAEADQTVIALPQGFVQVHARAARPARSDRVGFARRVERQNERRFAALLGDPPGDDADHPGVPTDARQHERGVGVGVVLVFELFGGGQLDTPLQRLAGPVEPVDVVGQRRRPLARVDRQQLDRQLSLAQPPGGVEPWGDRKADRFGVERRGQIHAGFGHQFDQTVGRVGRQRSQPVDDQHAIFIDQRHDVGHGADRRQGERPHQQPSHRRGDFLTPGGRLAQRPRQFERHAGPAQLAKGVVRARQPRVHDDFGIGHRFSQTVVVGDDQRQPEFFAKRRAVDRRDAAVDGDHHLFAPLGEHPQSISVEPVALVQSVGDVVGNFRAEQPQRVDQNRRGGHPVGVVIAVDHDRFFVGDRGDQPRGRRRDARQQLRVAEAGQLGVQVRRGVGGGPHPAGDEQLGNDRRQPRGGHQRLDRGAIVRRDLPGAGGVHQKSR